MEKVLISRKLLAVGVAAIALLASGCSAQEKPAEAVEATEQPASDGQSSTPSATATGTPLEVLPASEVSAASVHNLTTEDGQSLEISVNIVKAGLSNQGDFGEVGGKWWAELPFGHQIEIRNSSNEGSVTLDPDDKFRLVADYGEAKLGSGTTSVCEYLAGGKTIDSHAVGISKDSKSCLVDLGTYEVGDAAGVLEAGGESVTMKGEGSMTLKGVPTQGRMAQILKPIEGKTVSLAALYWEDAGPSKLPIAASNCDHKTGQRITESLGGKAPIAITPSQFC